MNSDNELISHSQKKLSPQIGSKADDNHNISRTAFRILIEFKPKYEFLIFWQKLHHTQYQKNEYFCFDEKDEQALAEIKTDDVFPLYFSENDFRSFANKNCKLSSSNDEQPIHIQTLMEKYTEKRLIEIVEYKQEVKQNQNQYKRRVKRNFLGYLLNPQNNEEIIEKLRQKLKNEKQQEQNLIQQNQISKQKNSQQIKYLTCNELIAVLGQYSNCLNYLKFILETLQQQFHETKFLKMHKLQDKEKQKLVYDYFKEIIKKLKNYKVLNPANNPEENQFEQEKQQNEQYEKDQEFSNSAPCKKIQLLSTNYDNLMKIEKLDIEKKEHYSYYQFNLNELNNFFSELTQICIAQLFEIDNWRQKVQEIMQMLQNYIQLKQKEYQLNQNEYLMQAVEFVQCLEYVFEQFNKIKDQNDNFEQLKKISDQIIEEFWKKFQNWEIRWQQQEYEQQYWQVHQEIYDNDGFVYH